MNPSELSVVSDLWDVITAGKNMFLTRNGE